jgi:Na+/H+-dicarboxylate symporter
MKKIPLHYKILTGIFLGAIFGLSSVIYHFGQFLSVWIKPIGVIFINLLKVMAVPLVFVSLVSGISSLRDINTFKRIGLKTVSIYIVTTVTAVILGLFIVNIIEPGKALSQTKRDEIKAKYAENISKKTADASEQIKSKSNPMQFFVDMFPTNIFKSASDNTQMLPVIVFAMVFGIAMVLTPEEKVNGVRLLFESLNEVILKMIDLIMEIAPFGVFALISSLIVEFAGDSLESAIDLFKALGLYSLSVLIGLSIMIYGVYGILVVLSGKKYFQFYKKILPVQMVAFSTSSSSATLPVTMDACEKDLGISNEVASFVLPVGATVNMDGTSLYQAVAAVFIAGAMGMELTFSDQATIVITAVLASIGSAGVPGAGMVMLVIVLNSIGVPSEGIALIFAVDRLLDMFRTTVNVTGDMVVATLIQESENKRKVQHG